MQQENTSDSASFWRDNIAVLVLVQNEIQRLDTLGIWEYYYPEIAATEQQISSAEEALGHSLDSDYRDFLLCSNGWKGFFQTVSLFGTGDLVGSNLMVHAMSMLAILEDEGVLEASGFVKPELLPIAAAFLDKHLFVMTRQTSHQPGLVIWFCGEEVERFLSFKEFFLAMADYNRLEIDNLKADAERDKGGRGTV